MISAVLFNTVSSPIREVLSAKLISISFLLSGDGVSEEQPGTDDNFVLGSNNLPVLGTNNNPVLGTNNP